jgi:hypothetical protein
MSLATNLVQDEPKYSLQRNTIYNKFRIMKMSLPCVLFCTFLASPASAITIAVDFSNSTSGFFDENTADGLLARAAVQAAADDLSAAITTSLDPLSTTRVYQGTSGVTTVTLTNTLRYTNPDTGASTVFSGSLASDEFRVYVGARGLPGSTLGEGGPGGVGLGAGVSGQTGQATAAAVIASANSTAAMIRGAFTISSLGGTFSPPFNATSFSTSYGPALGNLWFDNDGSTTWHLDHTTAVTPGTSDLYSVALHEMLHSLGIGNADGWDSSVSGMDWTGSEAIALYGTGVGLISADGGHIAPSIMSTRLLDGGIQEVVMDPNITTGTRKQLTQLDLAFLRDIGWQTIPEPSSTLLIGLGTITFILRRRR